jgi:hypothetical protein
VLALCNAEYTIAELSDPDGDLDGAPALVVSLPEADYCPGGTTRASIGGWYRAFPLATVGEFCSCRRAGGESVRQYRDPDLLRSINPASMNPRRMLATSSARPRRDPLSARADQTPPRSNRRSAWRSTTSELLALHRQSLQSTVGSGERTQHLAPSALDVHRRGATVSSVASRGAPSASLRASLSSE